MSGEYSDWAESFCAEHTNHIIEFAKRMDAFQHTILTLQSALMWICLVHDGEFVVDKDIVDKYVDATGNLFVHIEPEEDGSLRIRASVVTLPNLDDL